MIDRWLPEVTQRGRCLILLLPPLRLNHLRPADGASIRPLTCEERWFYGPAFGNGSLPGRAPPPLAV